jgi:hypothetical protein
MISTKDLIKLIKKTEHEPFAYKVRGRNVEKCIGVELNDEETGFSFLCELISEVLRDCCECSMTMLRDDIGDLIQSLRDTRIDPTGDGLVIYWEFTQWPGQEVGNG